MRTSLSIPWPRIMALAALLLGVVSCGSDEIVSDLVANTGAPCDSGLFGDSYACTPSHDALLQCSSSLFSSNDEPSTWEQVCACDGECRATEYRQRGGLGPDRRRVETECDCIGGQASLVPDGRRIAGL